MSVSYTHLVGDVALAEARRLVKDRQRVAHTAVGLLGYHVQRLGLCLDAFALCHHLEVVYNAGHGHAVEVINLATADDGGQYLVLLGGGEDEDDVGWRFLERLEEGVEGSRREHVYLVDDEDVYKRQLLTFLQFIIYHQYVHPESKWEPNCP